jgi:diguanylate cyclase (GGDEF)-like protein
MVGGMDRRVIVALGAGLAGLAAGVAGATLHSPAFGVLAGSLALGAAAAAVWLGVSADAHGRRVESLESRLAAVLTEMEELHESAAMGREAMRVAGTFAEMVAMRNLELARMAGSGGLLDEATGLLDGRYFEAAIQSRVASARRLLHPVTLVLFEIDGLREDDAGGKERLAEFASLLRRVLREADTACRTSDGRFAVILEDTPEGGGVWAAERIRGSMAREGANAAGLSAGVASYPLHALDAGELLERANEALVQARAGGPGHVAVAPVFD